MIWLFSASPESVSFSFAWIWCFLFPLLQKLKMLFKPSPVHYTFPTSVSTLISILPLWNGNVTAAAVHHNPRTVAQQTLCLYLGVIYWGLWASFFFCSPKKLRSLQFHHTWMPGVLPGSCWNYLGIDGDAALEISTEISYAFTLKLSLRRVTWCSLSPR